MVALGLQGDNSHWLARKLTRRGLFISSGTSSRQCCYLIEGGGFAYVGAYEEIAPFLERKPKEVVKVGLGAKSLANGDMSIQFCVVRYRPTST
jgi:hypothetical protein